jgi:hypothetical protein
MKPASAFVSCLLLALGIEPSGAIAADARRVSTRIGCEDHVQEASDWAGVSAAWVRKVMMAESAGRPSAVSRVGAMGCMQLMPRTWGELTARYRLGPDPFHPRANVFGGAAYLRSMIDRFGWPAALAAYNAGPGRLQQHLDRGMPLPAETRRYLGRILRRTGEPQSLQQPSVETAADWRTASLFVRPAEGNDWVGSHPAVPRKSAVR